MKKTLLALSVLLAASIAYALPGINLDDFADTTGSEAEIICNLGGGTWTIDPVSGNGHCDNFGPHTCPPNMDPPCILEIVWEDPDGSGKMEDDEGCWDMSCGIGIWLVNCDETLPC